MSVQLVEGFEGASSALVVNPSGGGGIRTTASGSWSRYSYQPGVANEWIRFKDSTGTHFYAAVRVYLTNLNRGIIGIVNSGGASYHINVGVTAGGLAYIADSTTATVGTGTTPLYLNAWNLVELEVTIGDSAAANVWVHGVSSADIAVSGKDFKNGADTTGFGLFLAGNTGNYLDDLIVYDSSGSTWNSRVGDKVVFASFPNAKGDQENWDPRTTGTVSRFYFPRPGRSLTNAGLEAPVGVAVDSSWEYTSGSATQPTFGRLAPAKSGTANLDATIQYDVSSAPVDLLYGQWVSPAVAAQTISGTFKGQIMPFGEENANDDMRSQVVIRVVSNDGATVRGTLYAGYTGALSSEWGREAGGTNRKIIPAAGVPATLSSVAASEGDRIVVEWGARFHGTPRSSVMVRAHMHDNSGTDLPEDETDTTQSKDPWIEFSSAITLSDDGNWDHVRETPPDDDWTYVTTNVDNDLDLYHLSPVPSSLAVSGPIAIKAFATKADPGTRSLTLAYKTSGSTQTGTAKGIPVGGYTYVPHDFLDVDATDSAAWTDTKINGLQIGPKATT